MALVYASFLALVALWPAGGGESRGQLLQAYQEELGKAGEGAAEEVRLAL